ncbi:MAG: N-formylglutamate amidohydrolase [Burkholderiales bacterium]|jgi:predicted N-formylglutamate amidohydrolase|nr:N-formylglutamate amidohydrolase [Burkholderiales bacterium]
MNSPGASRPAASGPPLAPSFLDADERPFELLRPDGTGAPFLTCDHASPAIPRRLGTLGLPESERLRHIGWDIGILEVALRLSARLDATLVHTNFSRLVIDCNRDPARPDAIAPTSDGTPIPGNVGITEPQRAARRAALFDPYHAAIGAALDARTAAGRPTVLFALHSFTPTLASRAVSRPWHCGTGDLAHRRTGALLRAALTEIDPALVIGDNQPYAVGRDSDWGVLVHGEDRGVPSVLLEIRQDQLRDPAGIDAWAARLARALPRVVDALGADARPRPVATA